MIGDKSEQLSGNEIAGVIIPWVSPSERPSADRLEETRGLVEALGCVLAFLRSENVRKPSPAYLLSGGLLDRLDQDAQDHECSIIVIDSALTPIQQRNLEKRLGAKVIDRTGLILEIFGLRALTREGRLQVELARLLYERSRLVRTWTHLERQRGGSGFLGGPGETQLESDKRMIDRQVLRLKRDLDAVQRTRGVQRAGRTKSEKPVVALIGYTNAGKSTLFNRLSGADVLAKDMPFATLDPTIRRFELPKLGEAALVDTVGFITDLPTHLVDSFRATLEETLSADLIIHVRDRSSATDEFQKNDVMKVMNRLSEVHGEGLPPIIEAWNKTDLLPEDARDTLIFKAGQAPEYPSRIVSALTGDGIESLLELVEAKLGAHRETYVLVLAPVDGAARAWLHENAHIEDEAYEDTGDSRITVTMSSKQYGQYVRQFEKS